jgi:hypothetical protein
MVVLIVEKVHRFRNTFLAPKHIGSVGQFGGVFGVVGHVSLRASLGRGLHEVSFESEQDARVALGDGRKRRMSRKKDGDEKYGGKTWQQQFHEASIEKSATFYRNGYRPAMPSSC